MENKGENKGRSKRKCEALTKKGHSCSSWAIKGSRYCTFHTEALKDRVNQGRREGGIVKKSWDFKEELPEVATYEDGLKLLNKLKRLVYTKKLPPVVANTLLGITAGLSKLIELKDAHGGGGDLPVKTYDFNPAGYEPGMELVRAHPEGQRALEIIEKLKRGETLALPAQIPAQCPTTEAGGGDHGKGIAEVEPAKEPVIDAEVVQEEEPEQSRSAPGVIPEAEKAEKQEEMQERREDLAGEKPTVLFTATEEYWNLIERRQNADMDLD